MRTAAIVANATHQTAYCPCGGPLEFSVTTGGYVLEECTRCHRSGEMQLARVKAQPPDTEREIRNRAYSREYCRNMRVR